LFIFRASHYLFADAAMLLIERHLRYFAID